MRNLKTGAVRAIATLALLASACSGMNSPTKPPGPTALTVPEAPLVNGAEAAELAAVRSATAAFHDVDKAVAAGYVSPVGGHCDQTGSGAMGVHSPNPGLIQNPALNPEQPEVLLYLPSGGGNYRLVAVEYLQTLLLRNTQTGQVAPWFSSSPWPAEYVVVNSTPSLFGQSFQGPMAGHVPGMPWHYDLHVWIWSPNPAGMFAQWNPSISCSE